MIIKTWLNLSTEQYKSIQKTSPCDLTLKDSKGWTAAHHAVCSLKDATFDNAEIVYLLGNAGIIFLLLLWCFFSNKLELLISEYHIKASIILRQK